MGRETFSDLLCRLRSRCGVCSRSGLVADVSQYGSELRCSIAPVPIRARVFVIIYALVELFAGLGSVIGLSSSHVAHFAHLGGLLFGWLLIIWWRHPEWKEKLFHRHPKLDSTKGTDYEDYHYHKRV